MITLIGVVLAVIVLVLIIRALTNLANGTASALNAASEGLKKVNRRMDTWEPGQSRLARALTRRLERVEARQRAKPMTWREIAQALAGLGIIVGAVALAVHLVG